MTQILLNLKDFRKEMTNILLPDSVRRDLAFYLAMEEYVAKSLDAEALFIWQTGPTVIFGRNQILENEVNLEYCQERGVEIVQRRSGGGCVYSDEGNMMISYVSRRGDVADVFERYLSSMTDILCGMGFNAVRSGRNDILVDGRKVSGNAFHQLPDRSIVHGTLLHSTDLDALEKAILPPTEKLHRHGVESVRQRVVNLSDIRPVCKDELKQAILSYFCDREFTLTPSQVIEIEELQNKLIWKKTF